MAYHLKRERDGAGDSGPMSILLHREPNDPFKIEVDYGRPKIGWCVRVGSPYSRIYAAQDYWTTTPIVEILGETENTVRFRTQSGSIYEWSDD